LQTTAIYSSDLFTKMLNVSKHFFGRNGVVLSWGCKTSSLQTSCFVIDNIETQIICHIALFHAIKENRTEIVL